MDAEPENRIVFHGTAKAFDRFDEAFLGSGGDANSALGFHFTDVPSDAADYAETQAERHGGEARVVVVRAATVNPTDRLDYYDFFGFDRDGGPGQDKSWFVALRQELLASGIDAVDYDDSEQDVFCILDPAVIETVAVLTPDEARACNDLIAALPDRQDDDRRWSCVEEVIAARGPRP